VFLKPSFADLCAPRATIMAPYDGQRISPELFLEANDKPFEIQVISDDVDVAKIQIEIRSKGTDAVWEPWSLLSGMAWKDGVKSENVTIVTHSERNPVRREFTFDWKESEIRSLGMGEYALRAVAQDKATRLSAEGKSQIDMPNVDLDAPVVSFVVDGSKPTVLTTIPFYQDPDNERIYRGELSATFNDDMRSDDFSDRTFVVTDLLDKNNKMAGYVSYSPALRKAIFVPVVPFKPNGFYRVEIKTDNDTDEDGIIEDDERGVHDLAGNPLDNPFTFTFRTKDTPFEERWQLAFSVTDGHSTDANNIVAVDFGALDGEEDKDVRAVPSLTFDQLKMNFLLEPVLSEVEESDDKLIELDRDIRPADGRLSHHWFFAISNAGPGSEVTINMRPSVKLKKSIRQYEVLRLVEFDRYGNVANTIQLDPTQAETDLETGEITEVEAYAYTNLPVRKIGEKTYYFDVASSYFRLDIQKIGFVATVFEKGTSGWRFFSVPITPQRADPFVNLGDDIDPFKMYKYDTALSGYKVYPLDIGEVGLQSGYGYFTRLESDVEVDVGGSSNHDDVTINLESAGWHAIGNPFVKEVKVADLELKKDGETKTFSEAVAATWIEEKLYNWMVDKSDDKYLEIDSSGQLALWDGYWLKTLSANLELTIPAFDPKDLADFVFPLPESYQFPIPEAPAVPQDSIVAEFARIRGQFDLKFALTSEIASDLTTVLGTRQNAKVGWDASDHSEPPPLSHTVAAYFDHKDWEDSAGLYNSDYQPPLEIGDECAWQLTVATDKPKTKMTLSWEDAIEGVPGDVMLYCRPYESNLKENEWKDMRKVRFVDLEAQQLVTKVNFEIRAERFEMTPIEEVSVIPGEGKVTIKWAASDNPFVEGYTVYRRDGVAQDSIVAEFARIRESRSLSDFGYNFIDTSVEEEKTYTYQVSVHFKSGAELKSNPFIVTVLPVIKRTALLQSYPNPFNPETWIPYELKKDAPVKIEVYNVNGQLVRTLHLGVQARGRYVSREKAAHWNGRTESGERAASGVYLYVLKAGDFSATRKMAIMK